MESSENLHKLFQQIFDQTTSNDQLLAVASLLKIWPPFEATENGEGAWYLVFSKLITDAKDGLSVVKIAREKTGSIQLENKVRSNQAVVFIVFKTYNSFRVSKHRFLFL